MSSKEDRELVSALLKASNEIHKKILDQKNYIHLPSKFIQQRADEEGVTFDEMLKIIEGEFNPK